MSGADRWTIHDNVSVAELDRMLQEINDDTGDRTCDRLPELSNLPSPPHRFFSDKVRPLQNTPKRNAHHRVVPDVGTTVLKVLFSSQAQKIRRDWDSSSELKGASPPWEWLRLKYPGMVQEASKKSDLRSTGCSAEELVDMATIEFVDLHTAQGSVPNEMPIRARQTLVQSIRKYAEAATFIDALREIYGEIEVGRPHRYQELPSKLLKALHQLICRGEERKKKKEEMARLRRAKEEEAAREKEAAEAAREKEAAEAEKNRLVREAKRKERKQEGRGAVRNLWVGSVQSFLKTADQDDPAWSCDFIKELLSMARNNTHDGSELERKGLVIRSLEDRLSDLED